MNSLPKRFRSVVALMTLAGLLGAGPVLLADTVSTAVGAGADVEMREQSDSSANGVSMNTRTSGNGDRNEIIGLRFDLSGYTLSELTNVSVRLTSFRNDSNTRAVRLFGVIPGTPAGEGPFTTEDWDETALPTFGSLPGLEVTDGDPYTQSINFQSVVYFGEITVSGAAEGDIQVFDDPFLTTWIQNHGGSHLVTFLLAAGTYSSGQFRIASKEATQLATPGLFTGPQGTFAPVMEFTASGSCTNCPPTILSEPSDRSAFQGASATFEVEAAGTSPLAYQWRFHETNLVGQTNATLIRSAVTTNQAGPYSVLISNAFGAITSAVVTLEVLKPGDFFDDFEPGIDLSQWSSFGGLVGSTVLATNYGGSVSKPGSLWFGAPGSRYAATRSLNASPGGVLDFWLRIANGSSSTWETADLPGEGVVVEYSTDGGSRWVEFGRHDTETYRDWTHVTNDIPLEAQTTNTQFRWRQLGNSGPGFDHWALDDVRTRLGPQPARIKTQPLDRTVPVGGSALFCVTAGGSAPLHYQWQRNAVPIPGATQSCYTLPDCELADSGSRFSCLLGNAYGSVTSSVARLKVIVVAPLSEFRILSLTTNNSSVVDHEALTGDDRGGIAASDTRVFYSGDSSTAGFLLNDLSGGTALGVVYDALASDLESGQVYSFASESGVLPAGGGVATRLIAHDGVTGALTDSSILLSAPIDLTGYGNVGIFSGYGRIVVHNGSQAYDIRIPSGLVVELGAMPPFVHQLSESWAYWGVAEYFGGTINLVYVRDARNIVRTTVPAGFTSPVATFSDLSDMACFTVSIPLNRWYFHHEGSSQFGGLSETLGCADATFQVVSTNPPVILAQPASQTWPEEEPVTLSVLAAGTRPLSYQWRISDLDLVGATNALLEFDPASTNDTGRYTVVVSNAFGAVTSSVAVLTILPPPTRPPNFDPIGFCTVQGETVGGEGGPVVTVDNASDFLSQIALPGPRVVRVEGTIELDGGLGSAAVGSHKTLLGMGTNAWILGQLQISGQSNVIVRNLSFRNNGAPGQLDGVQIVNGAHHVWVDHCQFVDCSDGELDITVGSDDVTVSWCKFRYTFNSGHNFVNLVGASDAHTADRGKLNITFHHNWWSTLCRERMPRVRYGHVHVFNNLYDSPGNNYCLRAALESQLLVENNYFRNVDTPWERYVTGSTNGLIQATNNAFVRCTHTNTPANDRVFRPPYPYQPDPVYEVLHYARTYAGVGKLAPFILTQPESQVATAGSSVVLSVSLVGATPMSYQWKLNGVNIPGATAISLTLTNVQSSDDGLYSVWISNDFGSALSEAANLKVNHAPVADASATRTVVLASNGTNAAVVLDGSRSYDPDGDLLQFSWYKAGLAEPVAHGAVAVRSVPVGAHSFLLVASDGLLTDTNAVVVEVITLRQAVERMLEAVADADAVRGNSLIATLSAALASIHRDHPVSGINQLRAFQNQVQAQIMPKNPQLGAAFLSQAQEIIDALNTEEAGRPGGKPIHVVSKTGRIHIRFSAASDRIQIVEASTNLVDWEIIGVARPRADGSCEFEDPHADRFPRRYYRVVQP